MEALEIIGTMRLAARVSDLKDDGHVIETRDHITPSGKHVARYVLIERKYDQLGLWGGR